LYKALDKPVWLPIAAMFLAVAIPAYHSQRVITPLMLLVVAGRHRKEIFDRKSRKYLIAAISVGLIVSLPTIWVMGTPGFLARASGLNIFSAGNPYGYMPEVTGLIGAIVNFRLFLWVREFFSLYVSYLSPRNMFELGDFGLRSSFPEVATFFVWQAPFYIYGLYILFKEKSLKEIRFFVIAYLLIGPIPAAVTRDPYSSIRALPLVVPQLVIISLGMIYTYKKLKLKRFNLLIVPGAVLLVVYSLAKLWSSAIILNEYYRGFYWDYGWEQVALHVKDNSRGCPLWLIMQDLSLTASYCFF
jgi:hypothetical protein